MRLRPDGGNLLERWGGLALVGGLLLACLVLPIRLSFASPPETLEAITSPFRFQGLIVQDVEVQLQGRYDLRALNSLVSLKRGEPLSLREVRRFVELLYRVGGIDDVRAEAEMVPGGVKVRFKVWPATVVRKVEFRGNRQIRDRKLREQLTLRGGSLYSWIDAKLQATRLLRFYHNEGFYQARVSPMARRRGSKRDVTFRIKEGPQARIVEILFEGMRRYPPRQLQQIIGLEEGRSFRPVELDDKRKALVRFLRGEGLLAARVKARLEFDAVKEWVTLRFEIDEGEKITFEFYQVLPPAAGPLDGFISRLSFRLIRGDVPEGRPRRVNWLRRRELLNMLELETELNFSHGYGLEAAERLRSGLVREGYDGATVSHERLESEDGSEATFKFVMEPRRKIRIQNVDFDGNHFLDDRLLKEVFDEAMIRFAPAGVYTREALDQALPLMADYYRSQGFLKVQLAKRLELEDAALASRIKIRIRIEEGQRTLVSRVEVVGNTVISDGELQPLIFAEAGQPYDPNQIRQTVSALKEYYASKGYIYARIYPQRVSLPEDPAHVAVRLEIDEGIQAVFGEIVVRGARRTKLKVIERELALKTGDVYIPEKVKKSRQRLLDTGLFEQAPVFPVEGERVRDMVVEVKERKARVVALSGGVLMDGFDLSLNVARFDALLEATHHNLWGLGHKVSARVEVSSSYFPSFQLPGAEQSIFPDYINQIGNDIGDYLGSATSRRIVLSYQSPYLAGARLNSINSVTLFERERLRSYLLHRNSIAWAMSTRDFKSKSKAYVQLQATSRSPDDETEDKVQLWPIDWEQRLLLQASTILIYDELTGKSTGDKGYLFTVRGEFGQAVGCADGWNREVLGTCSDGGAFTFDERYLRGTLSGTITFPLAPWLQFEARTEAGYLHPLNSSGGAVAMEKRFYLGGAGSVRGFSQDSIGPVRFREKALPDQVVSGWTTVATGGNATAFYTLELQVPLERFSDWFTDIDFSVFHDAGNVYWFGSSRDSYDEAVETDLSTDAFLGSVSDSCKSLYTKRGLRTTVGAGLRYRTGIGPIRLDVGFPVNRVCEEVEERWALHFSIGLF